MDEAFGLRLSKKSFEECRRLAKKPDLCGTFDKPSVLIHHANFANDLEVEELALGSKLRFLQTLKLGLTHATKALKRFEVGEVVCLIGPSCVLDNEARDDPNFEPIYSSAIPYELDQDGQACKHMIWLPNDLNSDPSINIMDTNTLGLDTEVDLTSNLDFHTVFADVVVGMTPIKIPMGIYVAEKTIEVGDYLICDYGVGYFNFSPAVVAAMYKEFSTVCVDKNKLLASQQLVGLANAEKNKHHLQWQAEKEESDRLKAENAKLREAVKGLQEKLAALQANRLNAEFREALDGTDKVHALELARNDAYAKWQQEKQVSKHLETEKAELQDKLANMKASYEAKVEIEVSNHLNAENAKLRKAVKAIVDESRALELARDDAYAKWQQEKQVSDRLKAEIATIRQRAVKEVQDRLDKAKAKWQAEKETIIEQSKQIEDDCRAKDNEIACLQEALHNTQDIVRRNMLDINEHQRIKNLLAIAQRHLKLFQPGGKT
jgi:hypothetical protein